MADPRLPGQEIVDAGILDLARGAETPEALLIALAATRLRDAGVPVPAREHLPSDPERRLYDLLCAREPRTAYRAYNALRRRLASYLSARDRERGAVIRARSVTGG